MPSHNVLKEGIPIKVIIMSKNNAYAVFDNFSQTEPVQNLSFFCYVTVMPTIGERLLTPM
jgi:hypothetical protein